MKKTIAYQGVPGAFSYITAIKEFGEEHHFKGCATFKEVFVLLEINQVDHAVLPIENSLIGSIYENYDLLYSHPMHVMGERYTKIQHCLLGTSLADMGKTTIRKVLSHPKALEQCALFFQKHPWIEPVIFMDTAAAAAEIAALKDPTYGAIASSHAAALYGLHILEAGIEDHPQNYTRFMMVAKKQGKTPDHADKCSLQLVLEHTAGTLAGTLQLFTEWGVNLTKIESRPLHKMPFTYFFYIDFEFSSRERKEIEQRLHVLAKNVPLLKILGFYKKDSLFGI